ncbi:MAG: hypothetical protein KatS3mg019_1300 [Fimbriimonadales bacterium]|nr:MAG: hypothetical protein KatS3mg019_1300 [Fimbriimonadales bacterium]
MYTLWDLLWGIVKHSWDWILQLAYELYRIDRSMRSGEWDRETEADGNRRLLRRRRRTR